MPRAFAQAPPDQPPAHDHDHMNMEMNSAATWHVMQDGVVYAMFNHQGSARGDDEMKVPNWWMGMASRKLRATELTLTGMFSLDAATNGKRGYAEILQVGEAVDGEPLIDRQHPHDLFMQLAAVWRLPLNSNTGLTFAGAPVGEPALGPVAFMHRPSAAEMPFAPLSHHTFDSTHIAFGVVTAAIDRGPVVVEGSIFNGREPDDNRWDFDFGTLDSFSGRLWYRPSRRWEFQVSSGHLTDPEELEPGDVTRTTTSAAWFANDGPHFTAVTAGYGVNVTDHGTRHAGFGEATRRFGAHALFGRVEILQVDTNVLLNGPADSREAPRSTVAALTLGATRDVFKWRGFDGAIGGSGTFNAVPSPLRATYGTYPVSFQVWFRLRPPVSAMGRMWNMRMSQPMRAGEPQHVH